MCIQKDRLILNKHCMTFLKKRGTPPESFVLYMKNVSEKTKTAFSTSFCTVIELESDSETPMQGQRCPNPKKKPWHITRSFYFGEIVDTEIMQFWLFWPSRDSECFVSRKLMLCANLISIPTALYSNSRQSQLFIYFRRELLKSEWNPYHSSFRQQCLPVEVSLPEKDTRREWEGRRK